MERVRVAYHPGEYILEELQARGRTQKRFAELLEITTAEVNDLIKGRRNITARLALRIGESFGTSAEVWINLQTRYDLYIEHKNSEELNVLKKISKNFEVIRLREEAEARYEEDFPSVKERKEELVFA